MLSAICEILNLAFAPYWCCMCSRLQTNIQDCSVLHLCVCFITGTEGKHERVPAEVFAEAEKYAKVGVTKYIHIASVFIKRTLR